MWKTLLFCNNKLCFLGACDTASRQNETCRCLRFESRYLFYLRVLDNLNFQKMSLWWCEFFCSRGLITDLKSRIASNLSGYCINFCRVTCETKQCLLLAKSVCWERERSVLNYSGIFTVSRSLVCLHHFSYINVLFFSDRNMVSEIYINSNIIYWDCLFLHFCKKSVFQFSK